MIAFGPVPSRRLGRSVGVNNIPPKICTYACVYCQLGRTPEMRVERQAFYPPEQVLQAVQGKVEQARLAGEAIDYLTFVPDGEPTLDLNLGRSIDLLRPLGIPIAVITNCSLIGHADVRRDLMAADWVSLKMDAVRKPVWRKVDRPHGRLSLNAILEGARAFAQEYAGQLVTETMLVKGVNDDPAHLAQVADIVGQLQPHCAYLSIPTRPPAEAWVVPPDEATINQAFHIFDARVETVEYLIGYEGNAFALTGDVEADLLSITAVHPMREDALRVFLTRADADWAVVEGLLAAEKLVALSYEAHRFYMRKLH